MDKDCLFCRIISGELKAEPVYENEGFIVIKDRFPQAPRHLLILPRTHYRNIIECVEGGAESACAGLFKTAVEAAKELGFAEEGFRTIVNTNSGGGQTVFHLHMHVLAGEKLSEEMT